MHCHRRASSGLFLSVGRGPCLAETDLLSVSAVRARLIGSLESRGFDARKDSALDREAAKLRDCALRTTSLVTGESYMLQTHSAMFYSVRSRVN